MNARLIRFSSFFILLVSSLIFTGCEFKDLTLNRVDSFEINEMNKDGMKGTISLEITNPNNFGITVSSADFELFSSKVSVGTASLHEPFKISANSTEVYTVKLNGNMSNFLAGSITGLLGALSGKNPEVTIKGNLKAKALLFSKTIPVEMKTEIPLDSFRR